MQNMSFCKFQTISSYNRYGASRKESWALVTGSAMGIGKAYSLELAKMGFNIVMIDKEDDKMETTKKELEALRVKVCMSFLTQLSLSISFSISILHSLNFR